MQKLLQITLAMHNIRKNKYNHKQQQQIGGSVILPDRVPAQ